MSDCHKSAFVPWMPQAQCSGCGQISGHCECGPFPSPDTFKLVVQWQRARAEQQYQAQVREAQEITTRLKAHKGAWGLKERELAHHLLYLPFPPASQRGQQPGPEGFKDRQEFENVVMKLIRLCVDAPKPVRPTQDRIAFLLRPELTARWRVTESAATAEIKIESTKRLIRKHTSETWPELVKKALQTP